MSSLVYLPKVVVMVSERHVAFQCHGCNPRCAYLKRSGAEEPDYYKKHGNYAIDALSNSSYCQMLCR
jgi:hypothetical protein